MPPHFGSVLAQLKPPPLFIANQPPMSEETVLALEPATQNHLASRAARLNPEANRGYSLPENKCRIRGILETSLYVENLERAARFYQDLFGFPLMYQHTRCWAMSVNGEQVLLLFKKGASLLPIPTSGGVIPASEGGGQLHLAFAIAGDELEVWERRLQELEVVLESKVRWQRGGTSLYFRDRDQHLIELVTPGCWSIY